MNIEKHLVANEDTNPPNPAFASDNATSNQ